jgi:hypothetical protein
MQSSAFGSMSGKSYGNQLGDLKKAVPRNAAAQVKQMTVASAVASANCAANRNCGTLRAMLRAQAVLVIVALLATPLALLARANDSGMADCNGMCCLPHGHHVQQPAPMHHATPMTPAQDPSCHHEGAPPTSTLNCSLDCAMHSSPHGANYGLLNPIAPTKPSSLFSLRLPWQTQSASSGATAFPRSGFLASPFQPPRA